MEIFYGVVVFIFGLVIGSFLNVCIFRIPAGESIAAGRSHCMSCGNTIRWYDLVPVLSWVFLGGRCRSCGEPISLRYPLVEASHALLWIAAYLRLGLTAKGALAAAAISILMVVAFIDWDTKLIYDRFSVLLAGLGALSIFLVPEVSPLSRLLGALVISVPMLVLALLTGGFGGGDIKLSAACGVLLGWRGMLAAAFFAVVSGGIYAVGLLIAKRAGRKSEMPFGPFIAAGAAAALLFGDDAIAWYLALCGL